MLLPVSEDIICIPRWFTLHGAFFDNIPSVDNHRVLIRRVTATYIFKCRISGLSMSVLNGHDRYFVHDIHHTEDTNLSKLNFVNHSLYAK